MPTKTEKELSPNARNLWLKATAAYELKNYGYAISLIQNVLKETPEFLDGRKILRRAEIQATKGKRSFLGNLSSLAIKGPQLLKKDPKAAMELAEKELEGDPYNQPANHLLKDAAKALGMVEVASFALETLIEGNPKETKNLHELGQHYLDNDDPDRAAEVFNKLVEMAPSDLIALKKSKDAAARQTMKHQGWEEVAGSGGDRDYRDLIKNKGQAVSLEQENRVVKSDEVIEQQLAQLSERYEQEPENIDVVRKIAALYEQKLDLETAERWYSYAAGLTGNTDLALVKKSTDLKLRIIEHDIHSRERFLAESPDHEEAPRIQEELDNLRHDKAEMLIVDAKKRVERNPTDLQFRFELGEQLLLAGHPTEAIPELQKARTNPSVRIKAMHLLGQCYIGKNMLDFAERTFLEAVKELVAMDQTKKTLLYDLGLLQEKLGKQDDYLDSMKQIYEVDYGYRDVAQRVEASYSA